MREYLEIKFKRGFAQYNTGETATFDSERAVALVRAKVAEFTDDKDKKKWLKSPAKTS